MWLTPKPASTRRIASESPCCVPTFIRALPGAAGFLAAGCAATCAVTSVSAIAPAVTPLPANRTNSRRFIVSSLLTDVPL